MYNVTNIISVTIDRSLNMTKYFHNFQDGKEIYQSNSNKLYPLL